VPAPLPGNKKFAIKNLLRVNRQQEKTRGNFLDKNKKGRRFYAAAFDISRIFYFNFILSKSANK